MTTKKLLCAAVVLATILTGCSTAPVKTEKKDKTEEISKKKTKDSKKEAKDSKKETKKNSEKEETAKNEEKTKEAAKIAEKDTKEAQKQHAAETKKAVETAHNKDQQTNHKTESTTHKHEDKKENKVENTENKPAESSKPNESKPSHQDKEEHKHNWEKVTAIVHHDAVTHTEQVLVRDAWTETIYGSKFRCGGCRQLFNTADELTAHQQFYMDQDDYSHTGSSVVTTTTQVEHPAEYETRTVVDKEAYDETVVTGYKCTICGATK